MNRLTEISLPLLLCSLAAASALPTSAQTTSAPEPAPTAAPAFAPVAPRASLLIAAAPSTVNDLPDAPGFSSVPQQASSSSDAGQQDAGAPKSQDGDKNPNPPIRPEGLPKSQGAGRQPKRILGLMPNYRAVSAGEKAPPPTSRQAFKIATLNSFDYSSYVFVGITSLIAKGEDTHPSLGKGVPGLWAYTWRGFVDKTDGNYLVIWALPTVLHEDERYYAMGTGPKLHRAVYAATRVLITPNYSGHNTFNAAEIFGRAGAQAISTTYYPSADRTAVNLSEKLAWSLGRDALTNTFREFWPDIAVHVLHRKS